jgi:hypothetical protein
LPVMEFGSLGSLNLFEGGYMVRNSGWILLLSGCLLAPVVSSGQTETHDFKITTRHSYSGSEYTTTTYFSGENSRSEMRTSSGIVKGHHRAIIRRKGAESIQVYDLDLDAHKYASYQTDLHGSVPWAKRFAGRPSGKTYVINIDVVDTGERKEMFGHTARHLITKEKRIGGPENCYSGGVGDEKDGWYIDEDLLPAAVRSKTGMSAALVFRVVAIDNQYCSDKIETHRTGPPTGFALDETTTWRSEVPQSGDASRQNANFSRAEVLEFVEAPLDPALFQVPPHFKKVKEIIDPTQRRLKH